MPIIDLAAIKAQVESSAANFQSLSTTLNSQVTGTVSALVPSVTTLQNAMPGAIDSLTSAAKSIGTTINGASLSSLPSMDKVLKGITPDFTAITKMATTALDGVSKALMPAISGLGNTLQGIKAEGEKLTAALQNTSASIAANNQKSPVTPGVEMITEIQGNHEALATYAEALAAHLFNPTGNPLPNFTGAGLNIDRLLENAQTNKDAFVDQVSGSVTSTIYKVAGVMRELGTRQQTKSLIYDRAIADLSTAAAEERAAAGFRISELRSKTLEQSEGQ